MVDRQAAGIGTSTTFGHSCRIFQGTDLIDGEHGGSLAVSITFSCDQGSAERSHDSCNVRTDRLAVGNFLKAPENRIIIESTTLYNDMLTKLRSIRNFDYLE